MGRGEDIIDGYFPLRVSIADWMGRRGLRHARLSLGFAPMIEVEGLPHDAPVPLNIASGRAGMIMEAALVATLGPNGADLGGRAQWRWLDGAPSGERLDPMTRLAEPALIEFSALADAPRLPLREIVFAPSLAKLGAG